MQFCPPGFSNPQFFETDEISNGFSLTSLDTRGALCIIFGKQGNHLRRGTTIRELKQATFLNHGQKSEVRISHARTVISPRLIFSARENLVNITNVVCEDKLNRKTARIRVPNIECLSSLIESLGTFTIHGV